MEIEQHLKIGDLVWFCIDGRDYPILGFDSSKVDDLGWNYIKIGANGGISVPLLVLAKGGDRDHSECCKDGYDCILVDHG